MRARLHILAAGCLGMLGLALGVRTCTDTHTPKGTETKSRLNEQGNQAVTAQIPNPPRTDSSKRPREQESEAARRIREKLDSIIIPKINFESTSAEEAIEFLRVRAAEFDPHPDPSVRGMAIHVHRPIDPDLPPKTPMTSVEVDYIGYDFKADNISAWQLLKRIASDNRMRIEITKRGIELRPAIPDEDSENHVPDHP